jgi:uncharacterized membrane protein
MDNLVAVVFGDEKSAGEGISALNALDSQASIAVNRMAVIKRNADGTVVTEREFPPPAGTLAGTAIGSLIGILGGPISFAFGAGTGALIGAVRDLVTSQVDVDFLSDVAVALIPGTYAILGDIDEEWVTPLDERMEGLGGVVFRTTKTDVRAERLARETAAWRAEIDELKAECAEARIERRAKLQARLDGLRARIEKRVEEQRARSKQVSDELLARVQALENRAEQEKGEAKRSIEARISRLREQYQRYQHL